MASLKVNKNRFFTLLDGLIIVLQITYGMSLLKVWLLDPFRIPYYLDITFLTLGVYLVRFRSKFILLKARGYFMPKLLLVIYAFDAIQGLLMSSAAFAFSRGVFMLNIYVFMEYLLSLSYDSRSKGYGIIDRMTRPYEIYSLYNIVAIVLCALLIFIGVLSPTSNEMTENSLFTGNMSTGQVYYFPGFLSVALSSFRLLSYLNIPILTGLSHEPHVIWWIIGPSLFMFLNKYKDNKSALAIIFSVSLILSLLATSATALLVFFSTMLLEFFYSFLKRKRNKSFFVVFFVVVIACLYIVQSNDFLIDAFSLFMDEKMNDTSDESSMGYSVSSLGYMFSPGSILGWGNVTDIGWGFKLQGIKISFVTFILDLILYISLGINVFKLYISKNIHAHYIGMACMYFLLHSLKMGAQVFTFPYFAYIIMLITLVARFDKTYR